MFCFAILPRQLMDANPIRGLPSRLYIRVIGAGARQNRLPPDYIAFLDRVADNGFVGDEGAEWLKNVLPAVAKHLDPA